MDPSSNDGRIILDEFYHDRKRKASRTRHHSPDEKRTLTVIAKYPEDGLYYLGKLIKGGNPSKVFFPSNNGVNRSRIERLIPQDDVIPFAGSTSWPNLQIWDYVLVKIGCDGCKMSPVFPGKIVGLPLEKALNHEKFYSVLVYTDKVVTKQRREIIKITEGQYDRLLKDLRERHHHKILLTDIQENVKVGVSGEFKGKVRTPDVTPKSSRRSSISDKEKKKRKHRRSQTDVERADKSQQTTFHKNKKINTEDNQQKEPDLEIVGLVFLPEDLSPAVGEEVLARWADDGWYYFGIVSSVSRDEEAEHESGGREFTVKDATGHTETVVEKNLFSDQKRAHKHNRIQKHDYVIANHPDFPHSYAPGQIKKISKDHIARIRFYDNKIADVDTAYVYVMTKEKYDEDVDYIEKCQKREKRAVTARDDKTGIYHIGTVLKRDEIGHMAEIQFTNGEQISQSIQHIFVFNQTTTRAIADYHFVLAPVQSDSDQYLPAKVTDFESPGKIMVEICDKKRVIKHLSDCFYINHEYYINAVNYYNCYINKSRAAFQHQDQPANDQNDFGEDIENEELITARESGESAENDELITARDSGEAAENEDSIKARDSGEAAEKEEWIKALDSGEVTEKEELIKALQAVSINAEHFQRTLLQLDTSQKVNSASEIDSGQGTNPLIQRRRWESAGPNGGSLKYGIDRETQLDQSLVEIIITCVKSRKTIDVTQEAF